MLAASCYAKLFSLSKQCFGIVPEGFPIALWTPSVPPMFIGFTRKFLVSVLMTSLDKKEPILPLDL